MLTQRPSRRVAPVVGSAAGAAMKVGVGVGLGVGVGVGRGADRSAARAGAAAAATDDAQHQQLEQETPAHFPSLHRAPGFVCRHFLQSRRTLSGNGRRTSAARAGGSMPLEILDFALVLLGRLARLNVPRLRRLPVFGSFLRE